MELFKNRTRVAYTNAVGDKVYPVIVDIKRGIKSTEEIQFMSSDINTGILSVAFIQGNDNYNVSGAEVVCSVMRPDASTLELPCDIVRDNVVEVPLGINGTSQDGVYSFDFKVFKGGNKVVGTPIMNYSVSLSISNDMVVEEDDRLPVLTVLMTQITALKNETNEVISTANTAIQNANKATDNTKLAISNAQSATQEAEDVIARVNNAIASGTQDLEVKEARDGEVTLKARLDRDIEKAKQVYVNVEGSHISTDSSSGYLKDVEILGNTVQDADNLADIRSVGEKVEGQELYEIPVLSVGKNLFYGGLESGTYQYNNGVKIPSTTEIRSVHKIKVNPNSNYFISSNKPTGNIGVYYYDSKENFIKAVYDDGQKIVTTEDTHFIAFRFVNLDLDRTVQIEEGTQATPYEPYQEDKITILLPVQLEKVGDVADRLIEKDGVWGVEKNIGTVVLNGNESYSNTKVGDSYTRTQTSLQGSTLIGEVGIICDKLIYDKTATYNANGEAISISSGGVVSVCILNSKLSELSANGIKTYITVNNLTLKYQLVTPQFIPLPHSQQVKLRTFANKTNISFLTEIEGTLVAQVPKSLGATVNTHTTQISNLNKELDRVKKLEESTVSTVTTESDFTTVEATSNGYFEDVKLEGKTLVNLYQPKHFYPHSGGWNTIILKVDLLKTNTKYYYKIFNLPSGFKHVITDENNVYLGDYTTSSFNTFTTINTITPTITLHINNQAMEELSLEQLQGLQILILEGDHTQNPPSFFEGLKSVGQGTDEIVVSSVKGDGNLISSECKVGTLFEVYAPKGEYVASCKSKQCTIRFYRKDKTLIDYWSLSGGEIIYRSFTTQEDIYYVLFDGDTNTTDIQLIKGNTPKPYVPYQTDKKRLLFYNEETQTWEKPVLREWDSIEKHSDGKYYYHQRSGEVVLNGSENWGTEATNLTNVCTFKVYNPIGDRATMICDKFITGLYTNDIECISSYSSNSSILINILKTKLSTQDVNGFKQWLQANNVTVVYQLAQEKVYECTNIDLITYANETNYIVESGAISPKSILKVHNNISNVVKVLQEKVSLLENKFIEGLKQVLAGDMYSLAELLYPEDFKEVEAENEIMLLPLE